MTKRLAFEEWLKQVNAAVAARVGVSGSELSDWNSWDTWNDGASVSQGADECIQSDDLFSSFEDFDF